MLWRALGHIPNGVYVDVGAQHPRIDSVSRAFYENGWRGTHVEPVAAFAEMLRADRPDETVLQLALGAQEGTLELNVIAHTGLSTAIQDYAERHQNERGYEVQRVTVPVLTLNAALRSLEDTDVHWLKIDVEGFEEQVLRGWQSERLRPWVLVVEATIPNSPDTDYENWEPIVTAAGYRFVYFDGLNRFYIANERPELADAFKVPPNIFDGVEVSGLASWELYSHAVDKAVAAAAAVNAAVVAADAAAAAAAQAQAAAAQEAELARLRQQLAGAAADAVRQREPLERELAAERELHGHMQAQIDTLRGQHEASQRSVASAVAHIEWLQGQHDAEAARLHAHIAWMKGQYDTEDARLHAHIAWMQGQLDAALRSGHEATAHAESLRQQVHSMYASTSWRVTGPLRRAVNLARRIKRKLRGGALAPTPMPATMPVTHATAGEPGEQVVRELSPRATQILAEIRAAIDSKAS